MSELDFKNTFEEPKLQNRNYVYLQLLEKRLKKFEYLEKNNGNGNSHYCFSSSDNSFLLEQDYSKIEHSDRYMINDLLSKDETIIFKKLLEDNLEHTQIFSKYFEKYICSDQEIYESFEKINLRYLGFKYIYNIYEHVNNYDYNKDYSNYIYLLDTNINGILNIYLTTIFVFEIINNNYDKEYIFYSDFSRRFYKTKEFIKLDYITKNTPEFSFQITKIKNRINRKFYSFIIDSNNKNYVVNDYFWYWFNGIKLKPFSVKKIYTKNTYTKGIQK
ncbi:hypothetical protein Hokovirus_3_299 [Hokovirus HKV1]|uniref:Uncharacterized protein n=1 Tax=Hokovirus HKV1 TaxID=1977638 RepID=A0A1V0SH20_9VIRU|nr:hypothetical protein Hokovirus_3_299 [Hokovirus HKV1]